MTAAPAPASLKDRAFRSGGAAIIGFGAAQAIRLISNLVMTRLLAPDAFGLMGITLTLAIWLTMASDLGVKSSVIRSPRGGDEDFLGTARTVDLARSALIALVLAIGALALPAIVAAGITKSDSVLSDPRLPTFLYCIALSAVISGLSAPKAMIYERSLNIAPIVRIDIGAQILSVAAMAAAASAGMGVYALAFGAVVAAFLRALASYLLLAGPVAPFRFNRAHFSEIFNYGKWLLIASTFGFLSYRGDQFVFGALFAIGDYSLYAIATIITLAAQNLIEQVQSRVNYPVFSELHRERPHDLTRVYRKTLAVFALGSAALFLGIVIFADVVIDLLYTDEYAGVAHYVRLVSVVLLTMPLKLLATIVLTSGDSRNFTISTIAPGVALFAGAPFVFHQAGPDAAIVFAALTPVLAAPINWRFARRHINSRFIEEGAIIALAIIAGALLVIYA